MSIRIKETPAGTVMTVSKGLLKLSALVTDSNYSVVYKDLVYGLNNLPSGKKRFT